MGTTTIYKKHRCKQCNNSLEEKGLTCLVCGSEMKTIDIEINETIKINDSINLKKFTQEIKNFVLHIKQGWFPSIDTEKHPQGVDLVQIVDRKRNYYKKKVIDKATGKIIKNLEQPLTNHH